jgi:transcriptional regulator with XRE-family HTH domain
MAVGEVRKSGVPAETIFRLRVQQYLNQHRDVSQRELARNAGISHVHLQHVLKGRAVPTLPVADQIARAIGWSLGDMLRG